MAGRAFPNALMVFGAIGMVVSLLLMWRIGVNEAHVARVESTLDVEVIDIRDTLDNTDVLTIRDANGTLFQCAYPHHFDGKLHGCVETTEIG